MTDTALVLLLILIVVTFSCCNHEQKVEGEWEGRYRRHKAAEFNKVKMRFEGNEVFCYEGAGNNIAPWVMRGDSIIITFSGAVTIKAKLNIRKNFMMGKGFSPTSVNEEPWEFCATKKATSNLKSYNTKQQFDVSGEWRGRYRYWKDAQFQKERLVFEGEEVFFYREGGNNIASWKMRNDSIILTFPRDVTIRGIINKDRTQITGKQFTPSEPDGEPGEFIANKQ